MGWGTHFYIWSSRNNQISRELGMCMGKNTQVGGSNCCDVWTHTEVCFDTLWFSEKEPQSLVQWDNSNRNEEPTTNTSWPFRFGMKKGHFGLFRGPVLTQTQRSPLLTHLSQGNEASDPEPAASAPFWVCSPSHSLWSKQSPWSEGIPLCRSARS